MNSITIVLMLIVGGILIYSAVKGVDPREYVKHALTQNSTRTGPVGKAGSAATK